MPHRAHVLRGAPHPGGARDDPGGVGRRAPQGAREDPAHAARGFRRHLQRDGRAPGHDPAARPAAARVPAERGRGGREDGGRAQGVARKAAGARAAAPRDEPDARPPRLPPRHHASGDLRDAGPGDLRGRGRGRARGRPAQSRDHDSARRNRAGVRPPEDPRGRDGPEGLEGDGATRSLQGRHDDRDPARGPARGVKSPPTASSSPSAPTT